MSLEKKLLYFGIIYFVRVMILTIYSKTFYVIVFENKSIFINYFIKISIISNMVGRASFFFG